MSRQGDADTSPLFTVIIPSKNRARFLHHTLRTCTMQDYEPFEVIVSDDGSTENNREVVEEASRKDPRIRFLSHDAGIGMRDNFEFALRQVKPGFVIALGGDDGLLPGGISGMRDALRDTGMELLAWPAPVYVYPDVRGPSGQLVIHRRSDSKIVDSNTFLSRQATKLHYLSDVESPMFYVKGVASTRLVDRVRSRSADGRFYSCPTPDGFSGIVLAGEVPQYAFSGKPFSIYGLSSESQGLAYLSNDEEAKKASESFMHHVSARPMHRDLASQPYSPLITLMTVDYLLTAKDLPGWDGSFPPIDYRRVIARGLNELAHGFYGDERIGRELRILNQIATYHGLSDFFQKMVRRSVRDPKRTPFEGSGINRSALLLDGHDYNLHDIVDAAYAATYLHRAYSDTKPGALMKILCRSLVYRLRAIGRGSPFPPESEWTTDTVDS